MQEKENKNIEELVDKMMDSLSVESPSVDFTNVIMGQVEALENKKVTTYKPLIPSYLWFVGGFLLVAITGYLFMSTTTEESTWFSALEFSQLSNNIVTQTLSGFSLPKTVMYAILSLGLMICIQVPVLKHYFDKRLSV